MYELALFLTDAAGGRAADPDIVRPGWLALGIVAALGVVVFFLGRSFYKQARKANEAWRSDETKDDVTEATSDSSSD